MKHVFLITIRKNFLQLFVIVLVFTLLGTGFLVQHRITLPVLSIDDAVHVLIVVEPGLGHAGVDSMVMESMLTGETESMAKELVMDTARKLQSQLEKSGLMVAFVARTVEMGYDEVNARPLDGEKLGNIEENAKLTNYAKPDIVFSLRAGYSANPAYFGAQALYRTDDTLGKLLAESIQEQFARHLGQDNRRARPIDGSAVQDIEGTLVLVEIGVLSNPDEKKLLESNRYRERLAYAIRCGVHEYLSGPGR